MPNWVKNVVTVSRMGDNNDGFDKFVKECLNTKDKDGDNVPFTFNAVVPMPESLDIAEGSDTMLGITLVSGTDVEKNNVRNRVNDEEKLKELEELGKKAISNMEKYGSYTWYNWRLQNWGTKWDACECYINNEDENSVCICFDTAWSTPEPLMQELSQKYGVYVFVQYADEDLGCNCGEYEYQEGALTDEYLGDYDFACELWGYDADELRAEWEDDESEG